LQNQVLQLQHQNAYLEAKIAEETIHGNLRNGNFLSLIGCSNVSRKTRTIRGKDSRFE
jgi:hypothetical protein